LRDKFPVMTETGYVPDDFEKGKFENLSDMSMTNYRGINKCHD